MAAQLLGHTQKAALEVKVRLKILLGQVIGTYESEILCSL